VKNGNGKHDPTTDRKPTAKEALKALRDETVSACAREIEGVLAKHDCKLIGIPGLAPDGSGGFRVIVRVDVVASPE
jgi:hypothetical protein